MKHVSNPGLNEIAPHVASVEQKRYAGADVSEILRFASFLIICNNKKR
jgi:hypothetical protein